MQKRRTALKRTAFWSARDQSRTDTPFLALPPESSASTNFATRASKVAAKIQKIFYFKQFFLKLLTFYIVMSKKNSFSQSSTMNVTSVLE